jgi:hypothetical protein
MGRRLASRATKASPGLTTPDSYRPYAAVQYAGYRALGAPQRVCHRVRCSSGPAGIRFPSTVLPKCLAKVVSDFSLGRVARLWALAAGARAPRALAPDGSEEAVSEDAQLVTLHRGALGHSQGHAGITVAALAGQSPPFGEPLGYEASEREVDYAQDSLASMNDSV